MATLKLVCKGVWATGAATVTHEKVDGIGWSYVVRWGDSGVPCTVCETLDAAMAEVRCDRVEIGGRQAAELSRD